MTLLDDIRSSIAAEFLAFLDKSPESISVGDFVLLYGQADLDERNATYEVQTYLPGWVAIGDDGGGRAMLMRLNGSAEVYQCGHGAIGSVEPELVAERFETWLAAECPIDHEDDEDDYGD